MTLIYYVFEVLHLNVKCIFDQCLTCRFLVSFKFNMDLQLAEKLCIFTIEWGLNDRQQQLDKLHYVNEYKSPPTYRDK